MNKTKILFFLSILLISCNNETKSTSKVENKGDEHDTNFQIVKFSDSGFYENIPGIGGNGPSLVLRFSIQNKTPHKITQFYFSRFARADYNDGEFEYFPREVFDGNENDDIGRFEHRLSKVKILENGEVWEPNGIREFELVIHQSGQDPWNFEKKLFERTPDKFFFAYKYYAISVDKEYENHQVFDMLEFWKTYQEEIGLR